MSTISTDSTSTDVTEAASRFGEKGDRPDALPHVVIVGGGFAGIEAARALARSPVQVTVIDRTNHPLFQPLLYQVAAATLSPSDIASPIRQTLRSHKNTVVAMAEVTGVDPERQLVFMGDRTLPYDYLVLATGAQQTYFGKDEWAAIAPGLKSVLDAVQIRDRVLRSFEQAELQGDAQQCSDILTFVLVGAGPTGVELAGTTAEMARLTLKSEFRRIDPACIRVILVQAGPRILPSLSEHLSAEAQKALEDLGVEVRLNCQVEHIDESGVIVAGERILCRNVFWTAGVQTSPAGKWLNAETDRAGRVTVKPDLSVQQYPNVFVVGDTAQMESDGKPVPGLAQAAVQSGRYAGQLIDARVCGKPAPAPFRYVDLGSMATIGRKFAVMQVGNIHIQWSGFPAKLAWLVVRVAVLNQLENQLSVLLQWTWIYLNRERGSRIITVPVGTSLTSQSLPQAISDISGVA